MPEDSPQQSLLPPLDTDLIREDRAAGMLGVSIAAMRAWRVRGGGPSYVKVGHLVRYRPADIKAFIDHNLRASTSQG
jgi:hypothetical protein